MNVFLEPASAASVVTGATAMAAVAAGALTWWLAPTSLAAPLLRLNRASAGLREQQCRVDGHRVRCLVSRGAAGAATPVVLLHGMYAEKDHWVDFVRALPGRRPVVVPDLPGFGHSDRLPTADYGYDAQIGRLARLLDALGTGPVHLAGSSMGGTLAWLFARAHPSKVASVSWVGAPHGLKSPRRSAADRLIDAGQSPLIATDGDDFDRLLDLLFHRRPWMPRPVMAMARQQALERSASNRRLWAGHVAERWRLNDSLEGPQVPLLALWGAEDRVFDVSGAEVLQQRLPAARVRVLPGVGHLPLMETPRQAARLLAGFLDEVENP